MQCIICGSQIDVEAAECNRCHEAIVFGIDGLGRGYKKHTPGLGLPCASLPKQAERQKHPESPEISDERDGGLSRVEATRNNPTNAWAYVKRADNHRIQCKFDSAIADASEAIRLDPKNAVAYGIRAESYRCRSEFEAAIADATIAIRLNHPAPALAYRTRGECFLRTKQLDRAISDASEAIRLDPTDPFPFGTRGMAFFEKRDFAKAFADLSEGHQLDPNDVLMGMNLKEVKRRWAQAEPQSFQRQLAFNTNEGKFSICGYEYDGIRDDWRPHREPLVIATANSREEAEKMMRTNYSQYTDVWIEPR